jgi:isopenicillin-N epimerase
MAAATVARMDSTPSSPPSPAHPRGDRESARSACEGPPRSLEPSSLVDPGRWLLDPEVIFLNHGSFGARTREVLDRQDVWRRRMERQPIEMIGRRVREFLAPSKERVASFVGADPEGLGFVTNATEGVHAALRSVSWRRGDRVVAIDHVYHAVRQTLRRLAAESGVEYVEVPLPLPIRSSEDVVAAIGPLLEAPTRLLVIDHVTSPTAVRMPIEPLLERCRAAGIETLVDGAHAPGMLGLDLQMLRPDHYTGNLHKWAGAPLGTAFLWSSPAVRDRVHPNVTSHFYGEGFAREFDWQGTRDLSAWITAAEAIDDLGRLGWDRVRRHNHDLCRWAHAMLVARWSMEPTTPLDGSMLGSIASIALPEGVATRHERPEALQAELLARHRIEIPVIDWGGRRFVRISAMVHNRSWQYERLAEAIEDLAT